MSVVTPTDLNTVKSVKVMDAVRTAWYAGRPIVPIVGAGLSADSGFPVLSSVTRYFGKFKSYVSSRAYLFPTDKRDPLEALALQYDDAPWRFVEDFGWPDRFQLNQDLLTYLNGTGDRATPSKVVEQSVRDGLDAVLRHINPHGWEQFQRLKTAVVGGKTSSGESVHGALDPRYALDRTARLIDGMDLRPVGHRPLNPVDLGGQALPRVLGALRNHVEERFERFWSNSVAFDLVGDWKKLIQYFTRSQGDYADALFATFGASREPSPGHRYLAFLAKLLGCRTIFTFNFDTLIEQALEAEGVRPEVFAMEAGAGLPHHTLIRDAVAVIKLHGGNHSLLLDERLDRPLGDEYMNRFDRIVRENPLLLVVGCSGNDYRLRDLVLHVLKRAQAGRARSGRPAAGPDVVWLHYERDAPAFLDTFVGDSTVRQAAVYAQGTNSPGAALLHLHSWLTRRCPAGRSPYLTHVQRPIPLRGPLADKAFETLGDSNFYLCSTLAEAPVPTASASQTVLSLALDWSRNGYQTIWVDLESVHTLAGVVGAIVDQCRQLDATLPPSVLPLDDLGTNAESVIGRAVELVVRALRRTRYLVVLDGLETYPWPATTHHGLTHLYHHRGVVRLTNLCKFLIDLVGKELGESRVCLAVDGSKSRHVNPTLDQELGLREKVKKLQLSAVCVAPERLEQKGQDQVRLPSLINCLKTPEAQDESPLVAVTADGGTTLAAAGVGPLVLFYLACFRRTRTLVSLDTVLRPILGSRGAVDAALAALPIESTPWLGMTVLEGGSHWFDRRVRNYLYENCTNFTSTGHLERCFSKDPQTCNLRAAAAQLLLTAVVHQHIARVYHSTLFVQSQDAVSFMEYTYHRLSSIRSLAKLIGLIRHVKSLTPEHYRAVVEGVRLCGEAFRQASPGSIDAFDATQFEVDDSNPPQGPLTKVVRRLFDWTPGIKTPKFAAEQFASDNSWAAVIKLIERELQERHRRELQSLHRAWVRCEGVVRAQVPAEQLLNWCEILLEDDLEHRVNSVVIGYHEQKESGGRGTLYTPRFAPPPTGDHVVKDPPDPVPVVNDTAEPVLNDIKTYFKDFQAKTYIERSDFSACIRLRHEQLTKDKAILVINLPDPLKPEEMFKEKLFEPVLEKCTIAHCHYLLDIVACLIRRAQELTTADDELNKKLESSPLKLLKDIQVQLKHLGGQVSAATPTGREPTAADHEPVGVLAEPGGDMHEAGLRLLYLEAECDLQRSSVFSHDGFVPPVASTGSGGVAQPPTKTLEVARGAVRAGLEQIRDQNPRAGGVHRSVVVEPTADGSLYFQYRSLFHTLRGRLKWMDRAGDDPEEAFEAAFRQFDLARGGLGEGNPLIAALAELYAVEASLARARHILSQDCKTPHGSLPLDAAVAKFETARVALQRARHHLQRGRRNVIWWKLYFSLTSQYHADRLLLGYARLYDRVAASVRDPQPHDDNPVGREAVTQYVTRLRRGYQSVRNTLDLYLPGPVGRPTPRWPCRAWLQMTLAAYAVGRLGFERHPESPFCLKNRKEGDIQDIREAQASVIHYLGGLNEGALLLMEPNIKPYFEKFANTIKEEEPAALCPHLVGDTSLSKWASLLRLVSGSTFTPEQTQ